MRDERRLTPIWTVGGGTEHLDVRFRQFYIESEAWALLG